MPEARDTPSLMDVIRGHPVRNALLATPVALVAACCAVAQCWQAFTDKKIPDWFSQNLGWVFMKFQIWQLWLFAVSVVAVYCLAIFFLFRPRPSRESRASREKYLRVLSKRAETKRAEMADLKNALSSASTARRAVSDLSTTINKLPGIELAHRDTHAIKEALEVAFDNSDCLIVRVINHDPDKDAKIKSIAVFGIKGGKEKQLLSTRVANDPHAIPGGWRLDSVAMPCNIGARDAKNFETLILEGNLSVYGNTAYFAEVTLQTGEPVRSKVIQVEPREDANRPKLLLVDQRVLNTETEIRFVFDLKNTGPVSIENYGLTFIIQTARMAGPPIIKKELHSQPIDEGLTRKVAFVYSLPEVPREPAYIAFHVSYVGEGQEKRWENVPVFFKWEGIKGNIVHLGFEYLLDEETARFKKYLKEHELPEPAPRLEALGELKVFRDEGDRMLNAFHTKGASGKKPTVQEVEAFINQVVARTKSKALELTPKEFATFEMQWPQQDLLAITTKLAIAGSFEGDELETFSRLWDRVERLKQLIYTLENKE